MATDVVVLPNVIVQGDLVVGGNMPTLERSDLAQDANQRFQIPATAWRVWDALATNLPATPANDDLGLVGGTFATGSPSIQTGDLKAAGSTTRYARCIVALPPEYDTAQSVTIRAHAGMLTTAADNAATIDFQAYRMNREAGIGSDLVSTAATSINNTTLADKDFVLDASTLAPGDLLDIRMAVLVNDASTVTAVTGIVGAVELLVDIKG